MKHLFDTNIAKHCGIEEAVILENIYFWCKRNEANNKLTNGKPWTYNSVKAFNEIFNYISPSKISRALKNLEVNGYIEIGEFNANSYDHTKWYCITDKTRKVFDEKNENSIFQNDKSNNDFDESNIKNSKITITDINTNNKPNINNTKIDTSDFPELPIKNKLEKPNKSKKTETEKYEEFLSSLLETERNESAKCVDKFIELHKLIDPYYNRDKSRLCWQVDFAKYHQNSSRSFTQILQVMTYGMTDNFWKTRLSSPKVLFNAFETILQQSLKPDSKTSYQKKQEDISMRTNMNTGDEDYIIY